MQHVTRFHPDELPDGPSVMHPKILHAAAKSCRGDQTVVRAAAYIGSFPVDGEDQKIRADCVRQKLETMRTVRNSKPVLLAISLSGIKVCSETGESVYMAHALRRISYATCDPEYCQFSFLAREPKGQASVQYCHAFVTKSPDQAEELNNIVGDAFKLAFSIQRQGSLARPQPSFNDVIERQLQGKRPVCRAGEEEQNHEDVNKRLQRLSTTSTDAPVGPSRSGLPKSAPPPPVRQGSALSGPLAAPPESKDHTLEMVWVKQQSGPQTPGAPQSQPSVQHQNSGPQQQQQYGGVKVTSGHISRLHQGDLEHQNMPPFRVLSTSHRSEAPDVTRGSDPAPPPVPVPRTRAKSSGGGGQVPPSPPHTNNVARTPAGSNHASRHPLSPSSSSASSNQVILDSSPLDQPPTKSGHFVSPVVALKEQLDHQQSQHPLKSPQQRGPPLPSKHTSSSSAHAYPSPAPLPTPTHPFPPPPNQPLPPLPPVPSHPLPATPTNSELSPQYHMPQQPPQKGVVQDSTPPRFYCNTKNSHSSSEEKEVPPPLPPVRFNSLRKYDMASEVDSGTGTGTGSGGPPLSSNMVASTSAAPSSTPTGCGFDTGQSSGSGGSGGGGQGMAMSSSMSSSLQEIMGGAGGGPGLGASACPLWYQASIPREIALEILAQEEVGSFVIRDSTSHSECYALSVKVPKFDNPTGITHYLIQRTAKGGVKLKGLDKEWPTLQSLVTHLTVMPEMLPCALILPRTANNPAFARADTPCDFDRGEDEDYQRLSDFSSIMANFRINL